MELTRVTYCMETKKPDLVEEPDASYDKYSLKNDQYIPSKLMTSGHVLHSRYWKGLALIWKIFLRISTEKLIYILFRIQIH